MHYKIGKSTSKNCMEAVEEAANTLRNPKLILFCSGIDQFEEFTKIIKKKFKNSITMGLSTYVALCKEGAFKNQLLVMGIEDGIECYGGILEHIDQYPLKYVDRVKESLSKLSGTNNTVCLEFTTGLVKGEESVITTLNSVLEEKQIPVLGGSAGNDLRADCTLVSYNGEIFKNGCAFVLIRNISGRIRIYRENIYKPTNKHHIATKVNTSERIVYEYDNRPAAKVMAEDLQVTVDQLPRCLDQHPWGRIMGENFYITANQALLSNHAISYHARVYKNAQMVLLKPDDYKSINKQTLSKIKEEMPHPSFAIVVHCLARSLLFEGEGYLNDFAKQIGEVTGDYLGFSGYGEQEGRQHFNQTMVIAVFE